jgi:hypothetical protein
MIVIAGVLSGMALCFGVLSLFAAGLWPYYVPVALVATLGAMHVIHERNRSVAARIVQRFPNLLSNQEREMLLGSPSLFVPQLDGQHPLFSGRDIVGVVQATAALAVVYGVLVLILQAWPPAVLSLGIILYSLFGPLATAFPASSHADSEARAVERCLARLRRKAALTEARHVGTCYWRTLDKLHFISAVVAQDSPQVVQLRQGKLLSRMQQRSVAE